MKNLKKYYPDLLFAAVAVFWLSNLKFTKITPLQYVIFGLIAVWLVMLILKLSKERRDR